MYEIFELLLKVRGISAAEFSRGRATRRNHFTLNLRPTYAHQKKSPLFKQITGFSNSNFRPFIFRLPKPRLKPLEHSKF